MYAFLRFRVGHEWYAIDVTHVVEVLRMMAITPLPDAPPHVLGVITMRGQVVQVVDLRRYLSEAYTELNLSTPLVALRDATGRLLLVVVDEVDDIVHLQDYDAQAPSASQIIAAVTRHNQESLLVVDMANLMRAATRVTEAAGE
ncbi:MAG: chemotaxis protein CheW [Chloroflexota bacterium]